MANDDPVDSNLHGIGWPRLRGME